MARLTSGPGSFIGWSERRCLLCIVVPGALWPEQMVPADGRLAKAFLQTTLNAPWALGDQRAFVTAHIEISNSSITVNFCEYVSLSRMTFNPGNTSVSPLPHILDVANVAFHAR